MALASTMRNRASYDANESISSANNDAIRNLTNMALLAILRAVATLTQ